MDRGSGWLGETGQGVRHRSRSSLAAGLVVAAFGLALTPSSAGAAFGVALGTDNSLMSFETSNPAAAGSPVPVAGLTAGDSLVAIDFRPQNNFLYGLGFNSVSGTVTLYNLSHRSGQATPVGAPVTFADSVGNPDPVNGTNFGFDFNPTVDRIRVVDDASETFRLNPNNGAGIDGNPAQPGTQIDGTIGGATSTVDATAYTNNEQNATVTTLYTLSAANDRMFIQNPPNSGTQTTPVDVTLNGGALDFGSANGFDILPGVNVAAQNAVATGVGHAVLTVGGTTGLYTIDLASGAATSLGPIGNGSTPIRGMALLQRDQGVPAIAFSDAGTELSRFRSTNPVMTTTAPITGTAPTDVLVGIDWRPQTGQLFGFAVNDSTNSGTLYVIDPQTGGATAVGFVGQIRFFLNDGATPVDLPGTGYGVDFNPITDQVRVVTNTGLNFRLNPNSGSPVDGDASAPGSQTDTPINGLPAGSAGMTGAAYTNNFAPLAGTGVTTQYVLDPSSNMLFIQNPPNGGTATAGRGVTLGGSALDFDASGGFDIPGTVRVATAGSEATGEGLAALRIVGAIPVTSLYRIDLSSGAATEVGQIGAGGALGGLAIGDLADPPAPSGGGGGPGPPGSGEEPPGGGEEPPGDGGPPVPRAFGPRTLVELDLAKARIRADDPVQVLVSNDNSFPVTGELSGKAAKGGKAGSRRARAAAKLKPKPINVSPGGEQTVKMKLPKSLRQILVRKRKLKLQMSAALLDPAGNSRRVDDQLVVKPKTGAG